MEETPDRPRALGVATLGVATALGLGLAVGFDAIFVFVPVLVPSVGVIIRHVDSQKPVSPF